MSLLQKKQRILRQQKTVWNYDWLKTALTDSSFNKCCYTEIELGVESKYMEVEHFYHKDKYPERVLDWNNLLPSCKTCNGNKGDHDVGSEPIINPYEENPKEFFILNKECIKRKMDLIRLK